MTRSSSFWLYHSCKRSRTMIIAYKISTNKALRIFDKAMRKIKSLITRIWVRSTRHTTYMYRDVSLGEKKKKKKKKLAYWNLVENSCNMDLVFTCVKIKKVDVQKLKVGIKKAREKAKGDNVSTCRQQRTRITSSLTFRSSNTTTQRWK
jgi:hypothetical protein